MPKLAVPRGEIRNGKPVSLKRPGVVRRRALNMKTTEELRARMEELALASGRSLTLEVEFQLTRAVAALDLEATLRRVVREEIAVALDMPLNPNATTIAAMESARRGDGMTRIDSVADLVRDVMDDEPIAGMQ